MPEPQICGTTFSISAASLVDAKPQICGLIFSDFLSPPCCRFASEDAIALL
ncbi:MAG TPA: hypothetical protein V6D09_14785 [Leptolyngbyaceae cyanobacterium]